jgi:dethiobiotin synthetase
MARKLFVAGTGQHSGKTTTSLALMHLAQQRYGRVGFMKPVGPKSEEFDGILMDQDAILIARVFGLEEDLPLMSPVAFHKHFTRDVLTGTLDVAALRQKILTAAAELERKYDLLVIEGAGHSGVGSVIGLSNARVAQMIDAPVIMVADGGIGSVIDAVHLNRALFLQEGGDISLVMVNKLLEAKRQGALDLMASAFTRLGLPLTGGFTFSPTLANPTLAHISDLLSLPIHGDRQAVSRIIHTIQLGAASSQKVIDGLDPSTLLIITSSRDELLVTLSSLYHIPEFRERIVGVVIAGHVPVSRISQQILDDSGMPFIRIQQTTAEVFRTITDDVAKITPRDLEKIAWIRERAASELDFSVIERLLT